MNVVGTLADLMLGRISNPKYFDPVIPLVNVHINRTRIPKSLINLGATTLDQGLHAEIEYSTFFEEYCYHSLTS